MVQENDLYIDYSFIRRVLKTKIILANVTLWLCFALASDYLTYALHIKDFILADYLQTVDGTHILSLISFMVIAQCSVKLNTVKTLSTKCISFLAILVAVNAYYIFAVQQDVFDPIEAFFFVSDNRLGEYYIGTNTSLAISVIALSQLAYYFRWKVGYMLAELSWVLPLVSTFSYLLYQLDVAGHMSILSTILLVLLACINVMQYVRKPHLRNIMLDAPSRKLVTYQTAISIGFIIVVGMILSHYYTPIGAPLVYFAGAVVWGAVKINISFGDKYSKQRRLIVKTQKSLHKLATYDKLTDVKNRLGFSEVLEKRNPHNEAGIILCDIDHFKSVNDKYGHDVGDVVIRRFADTLKKASRSTDTIIRWGGEEFIVLCEDMDKEGLHEYAEKLRIAVQDSDVVPKITASFGAAIMKPNDKLDDVIKLADQRLYQSKRNGRNQVTFDDDELVNTLLKRLRKLYIEQNPGIEEGRVNAYMKFFEEYRNAEKIRNSIKYYETMKTSKEKINDARELVEKNKNLRYVNYYLKGKYYNDKS